MDGIKTILFFIVAHFNIFSLIFLYSLVFWKACILKLFECCLML